MSAYDELLEYLNEGETVESIVFGPFGWGSGDKLGYGEPESRPVPLDQRRKLLTLEEARPFMQGWPFDGDYGAPKCYATYIWTDQRCIWVTQYDGSTCLSSMPRNPTACTPSMPGG